MNEYNFYLRRTVIIVVLTIAITLLPLLTLFTTFKSPSESYLARNTNDETVAISEENEFPGYLNFATFIQINK